jgi:GBP family porin
LYGVADSALYYNHVSRQAQAGTPGASGTQIGMTSGGQSGSRFGIKGVEALSHGRRVGFVFEGGINITNGTMTQGGLGFGRQTTLWIQDPELGKLELGRRSNVAHTYMGVIDPLALAGSQSTMGTSFGSANSVRYNNLLVYETANIAGFQASIGYSFNTGTTAIYQSAPFQNPQPATTYYDSSNNQRALTAGFIYGSGPLTVIASYDQVYAAGLLQNVAGTQTVPNNAQSSPKAWILGMTYDFTVIKLAAAYGQTIGGAFFGQTPGPSSQTTMPLTTATLSANMLYEQALRTEQMLIGATLQLASRQQLAFSWQRMRPVTSAAASPATATQSVLSAMYTYDFSQRTNGYIWASYGNNFQMVNTARSSVIGFGVRHRF